MSINAVLRTGGNTALERINGNNIIKLIELKTAQFQ